jgi:surfeit locus 1 family protein
LRLDNGQYLLVDRGWIPYVKFGKSAYERDNFFRPSGSVLVSGILKLPQHHEFKDGGWPTGDAPFWTFVNLSAMAKEANVPEFLPYVLEVDATPNPGGYPVGGQTRVDLPNNHLSYAITWYGLALALLVIYGVSSYRKVS